ncbi:MAG: hypothetical protein ACRDIB_10990, partial [Ardenticatenaceae bacterium]
LQSRLHGRQPWTVRQQSGMEVVRRVARLIDMKQEGHAQMMPQTEPAAMDLADNWWAVLFNGTIAAVLGGLATLAGVWLIIRHERNIREADAVDEGMKRLAGATSLLLDLRWRVEASEPNDALTDAHRLFVDALIAAGTRSRRSQPVLSEIIEQLQDANASATDLIDPAVVIAANKLAAQWVSDPGQFRSRRVGFEQLMQHGRTMLAEINQIRAASGSLPIIPLPRAIPPTSATSSGGKVTKPAHPALQWWRLGIGWKSR